MINITDYCVHQRLKKDCAECLIKELKQRVDNLEDRVKEVEAYIAKENFPRTYNRKKSIS